MIRSRAAFRFWTAMSAAPAAVASIASCAGNAARPPDAPITPLVVGSGSASPLEVSPEPPEESSTAGCRIDQYRESTCRPLQFFDPTKEASTDPRLCPATTPTGPWGPFDTHTTARLDREKTQELVNGYCCYDWCEQIKVTQKPPAQCTPPLYMRTECIAMPERGTTSPAEAPFDRCPSGIVMKEIDGQKGAFAGSFEPASSAVGESETASRCCYAVCGPVQVRVIPGRAARDGDAAVTIAPAVANASWRSDEHEGGRAIPLADALFEHASIAAFSQLSLSLLAFGAPPDLLVRTHEAALDEIRHAQTSFTRAGGAGIGPGPCPAFADLRAHASLADLAEETYVDGCIGETIASLRLRREGMAAMARDEERHAELAWRIVEWALTNGGDTVRERIADAAERTEARDDDALTQWAYANVIAPCTKALLETA